MSAIRFPVSTYPAASPEMECAAMVFMADDVSGTWNGARLPVDSIEQLTSDLARKTLRALREVAKREFPEVRARYDVTTGTVSLEWLR